MTTAMYDAREAIIPGSVYDRSSQGESLQGAGPALWLLTIPTPTASSPVNPGWPSKPQSTETCLTMRVLSQLLLFKIK